MKEQEFLKIIKNTAKSKYIGDDCAYLKDFDLVVSQDNLVENVHFSMKYTTPYQLGYKSAMVNISDIAASGAVPKFLSIGLSLPKTTSSEFVKEFYNGLKYACQNVEIIGGDITGSEKIFVSICAFGSSKNRKISSRSNAKIGYKIITSGMHGSSGAGLRKLLNSEKSKFNEIHLMPKAQLKFSDNIASKIDVDYAMMDTSDGLMDALWQIANSSSVKLSVNFEDIPYDKDLNEFDDYKDLIFYGGEDYQLVACVPENFEVENSFKIGEVKSGNGVEIDNIQVVPDKFYNHF